MARVAIQHRASLGTRPLTGAPWVRLAGGRVRPTMLIGMCMLLVSACRGGGHSEERPPSRPVQDVESTTTPKAPSKPDKELSVPGKHALPVKFPAVKPEFEVGQRALAVPQNWLENALEFGVDRQVISLYDARIAALGAERSEVKSQSGGSWTLPNAVIVALPSDAKAKPGELVLTHWPQGGSWMRAVIVDGPPESPKARLLDVPLDEPAGWGRRTLELEAGSFLPLSPGQSGASAACKQGTEWRRYLVIQSDADSVLGLGFGGKLESLPKGTCRFLPLAPKLELGATVQVPRGNSYVPATVLGVSSPAAPAKPKPAQPEAAHAAAPPAPSQAPVEAGASHTETPPGRVRVQLQLPPRSTLDVPRLDVASVLP